VSRRRCTATTSATCSCCSRATRSPPSPEPDTQGAFTEYLEADVVPGNVVYIEKGGVETAKNVGKEPYGEIIIELKD
jgi:hypothetical protein